MHTDNGRMRSDFQPSPPSLIHASRVPLGTCSYVLCGTYCRLLAGKTSVRPLITSRGYATSSFSLLNRRYSWLARAM